MGFVPAGKAPSRINPGESAYRPLVQHIFRVADAHDAKLAPIGGEVDVKIAKILETRQPTLRNAVHPVARLNRFLRGKVPSSIWRKAVEHYLGLQTAFGFERCESGHSSLPRAQTPPSKDRYCAVKPIRSFGITKPFGRGRSALTSPGASLRGSRQSSDIVGRRK